MKTYSRDEAIAAVKDNVYALRDLPQYNNDKDVVLAAVSANGVAIRFASPKLQYDGDVVRAAVAENDYVINMIDPVFKNDKVFALFFFSFPGRGHYFIQFDNFQHDRDVALAAVGSSGLSLMQMPHFQDDEEIVTAAVANNAMALGCAGDDFRGSIGFAAWAVSRNGHALEFVAPFLKSNRHVVRAAVRQNGEALEHADDSLKANRLVIETAIDQDGEALQHAKGVDRFDPDLARRAVRQNGLALKYVMPGHQSDRNIVLDAVTQNVAALHYMDRVLESDIGIALAAVRQDGLTLGRFGAGPRNNRAVVLAAVGQNGLALRHASLAARSDMEVVLASVSQNARAWEYISEPFRVRVARMLRGKRGEEASAIIDLITKDERFKKRSEGLIDSFRSLLLESKVVSLFFGENNLYVLARSFMHQKFLPDVCANIVLEFLCTQNVSNKMMVAKCIANTVPSSGVASGSASTGSYTFVSPARADGGYDRPSTPGSSESSSEEVRGESEYPDSPGAVKRPRVEFLS